MSSSMWFSSGVGAKTVECKPSAAWPRALAVAMGARGTSAGLLVQPLGNVELWAKSLTPSLLKCRMGLSAPVGEPCRRRIR